MISDAAAYVTEKLTETAAERFGSLVAWAAIVGALGFGALAFGSVAGYLYLAPIYGPLEASAIMAGGCLLAAVLAALIPWATRRVARASPKAGAQSATFTAVNEEVHDAVDYFGAAKVMATAFMFGLGMARRLKR